MYIHGNHTCHFAKKETHCCPSFINSIRTIYHHCKYCAKDNDSSSGSWPNTWLESVLRKNMFVHFRSKIFTTTICVGRTLSISGQKNYSCIEKECSTCQTYHFHVYLYRKRPIFRYKTNKHWCISQGWLLRECHSNGFSTQDCSYVK